jgi:hypothetical protein
MAAMETQDDGSSDDGMGGRRIGRGRRDSLISLQESLAGSQDPFSPRRRARHVTRRSQAAGPPPTKSDDDDDDEEDDDVANASSLFVSMCKMEPESRAVEEKKETPKKEFVRKAPIRRVSRRTSYDSRISDMSDFDELDSDLDS